MRRLKLAADPIQPLGREARRRAGIFPTGLLLSLKNRAKFGPRRLAAGVSISWLESVALIWNVAKIEFAEFPDGQPRSSMFSVSHQTIRWMPTAGPSRKILTNCRPGLGGPTSPENDRVSEILFLPQIAKASPDRTRTGRYFGAWAFLFGRLPPASTSAASSIDEYRHLAAAPEDGARMRQYAGKLAERRPQVVGGSAGLENVGEDRRGRGID